MNAHLPLRILLVEDSDTDAALVEHELRQSGLSPTITRAETEAEIHTALAHAPDLILADYVLTGFTAIEVLGWFEDSGVDAPFILVSGTIDAETAVATMRAGASDYILKSNLASLPGAVYRAIDSHNLLRAKKTAEEKVASLAHMLDFAPDAIIVCGFEGNRIQYWNKGAEKLYGWTAKEAATMSIETAIPCRKEEVQSMHEMLVRHGEWSIESYKTLRDGRVIAVSERATLARDADGKPTAILLIHNDITSQKRIEVQLREQARLLDLAADAILVSDFKTGEIIYWNKGAERMHGWKSSEVIGQSVSALLLTDERDAAEILRETITSGEWSGELCERTRDGQEITVRSRITLVRDEEGQPKSLLTIHTDVTEGKAMEAQFLRTQRLESLGTLASGIAHDLNNILSPIIMAAPLLISDLQPETRRKIVETINLSARRGADVVRQVLMFARGLEGHRLPVDCQALLKEIASIVSETFPKSIAIKLKSSPGLWPALGDSTQLQQILLNLVINSRDAMANGGTLTISASNFVVDESFASMTPGSKPGQYVLLQVTDTGTGIPKNVIDKIFDPFFTTKEVGSGTGLGLSTVLGIVKSHGGFLGVESNAGAGATLKVFIPAAVDVLDSPIPEEVPIPRGNGEMVLLVEDELNIRIVAEAILIQAGYRVLTAADGTEAIARYADHRAEIKVVVTDAVMPFLDGAALTRALRNLDPKIRIIGTSGYGDDQRAKEFKALGLDAFLSKPYDKQTLLLSLQEILRPIHP